jgi:PmbA protein
VRTIAQFSTKRNHLLEKVFQNTQDACARHGIKEFEIYAYEESGLVLEVEDGECENQEVIFERGVALRLRRDGLQGIAASRDINAIEWLVTQAIDAAENSSPRPLAPFRVYPAQSYPTLSIFDPTIEQTPLQEKLALAQELEARAKEQPKISRVLSSTYQEQREQLRIVNSAGLDVCEKRAQVSLSVQLMASHRKDSREGWDAQEARSLSGIHPAQLAHSAADQATQLLGATSISSRKCPVIFSPFAASELLSLLSSSFSGELIRKKTSRFAEKLGQQVASKHFSLLDDPLCIEGVAASSFDEEGTPRRQITLIQDGILQNFLYDETEALLAGLQSTGHATKGDLDSLPSLSPSNILVKAGAHSKEALLREMKRGLWVQSLIGSHLANPTTGEFSFGAVGAWVQNGTLQKPVAEITISGDLFSLLQKIALTANDLRFFGNIGCPSLLLEEISVSG